MRKLISVTAIALVMTFSLNTGCTPGGGGGGTPIVLPNIAGFAIQSVSAFVAGASAMVSIAVPSLAAGVYTLHFDITGDDNFSNQSATINVSGSTVNFQTPSLPNPGSVSIHITSITNSSGGSATITSNNTKTFSDSTGLMTGTYTVAGSVTNLRATHVVATNTGGMLSIHCVIWTPNLTTVTLYDDIYAGATGSVSFNSNDLSASGPTSTFNGGASFGIAGSGITVSDLSEHGTITLNTIAPLMTGTFTFTNQDSSVVAGSFSCPHP